MHQPQGDLALHRSTHNLTHTHNATVEATHMLLRRLRHGQARQALDTFAVGDMPRGETQPTSDAIFVEKNDFREY